MRKTSNLPENYPMYLEKITKSAIKMCDRITENHKIGKDTHIEEYVRSVEVDRTPKFLFKILKNLFGVDDKKIIEKKHMGIEELYDIKQYLGLFDKKILGTNDDYRKIFSEAQQIAYDAVKYVMDHADPRIRSHTLKGKEFEELNDFLRNKIDYSDRYNLDSSRLSITTKHFETKGETQTKVNETFKNFLDRISIENSTIEKSNESTALKPDLKNFQERLDKERNELKIKTPSK
jgi:hypothetical protein